MPDALSLSCELVQDLKEGIHLLELYKKPTDLKRKKLSLLSVKELCVLHPPPSTLHPESSTLYPQLSTPNPQPRILNRQPSNPSPQPPTPTPNPQPPNLSVNR